ncbi:hypothetical protein [Ligilactobacillus equi]|uniref:Uncharacterized protein n=1 Tax=Ligilactobacillus equi DSM 15833 = JCM 10991 TaxID=1423740 RepID=A0A0R1TTZ1_9LACO|nr:hypothetical protein [Ligilactobacillus equi]KRL84318.1 hypothetical protein FC36_GL000241 [Ligilactobacillus equi DSM 15833 = JCM 10991]
MTIEEIKNFISTATWSVYGKDDNVQYFANEEHVVSVNADSMSLDEIAQALLEKWENEEWVEVDEIDLYEALEEEDISSEEIEKFDWYIEEASQNLNGSEDLAEILEMKNGFADFISWLGE